MNFGLVEPKGFAFYFSNVDMYLL